MSADAGGDLPVGERRHRHGPGAGQGHEDPWLINAGKQLITLAKGGTFVGHADSFAMIRGGHIDLCVLGAFEVAENGDLANWATSENDTAPAVGGAMDLAAGAKRLWVIMEHTTKDGRPKLVERCGYPLTGLACVRRVYTNLAVLDVVPEKGFVVVDLAPGRDARGVAREDRRHPAHELKDGTSRMGRDPCARRCHPVMPGPDPGNGDAGGRVPGQARP